MTVRAFTYGYDFYTPSEQVCFHYYAWSSAGMKKDRQKVPLFFTVLERYTGHIETKSMQRLNQIIELRIRDKKEKEVRKAGTTGLKNPNGQDEDHDIYLQSMRKRKKEEKERDLMDVEKYGIGMVRSPDLFYDLYGIDRTTETVAKGLCTFAGKNMHYVFLQHLRDNRMGIDYTNMTYRFKDIDEAPNSWGKLIPPMTPDQFQKQVSKILANRGNGHNIL